MEKKHWTQDQTDFLIKNYKEMTISELASNVDRNTESVRCKMRSLNLSLIKKEVKSSKGFIGNPIGKIRIPKKNLKNIKDEIKLIPVKIDNRTTIYIKEGQDPEQAKDNYIKIKNK
jgi:predicted DNA-binding transcriptional regulator